MVAVFTQPSDAVTAALDTQKRLQAEPWAGGLEFADADGCPRRPGRVAGGGQLRRLHPRPRSPAVGDRPRGPGAAVVVHGRAGHGLATRRGVAGRSRGPAAGRPDPSRTGLAARPPRPVGGVPAVAIVGLLPSQPAPAADATDRSGGRAGGDRASPGHRSARHADRNGRRGQDPPGRPRRRRADRTLSGWALVRRAGTPGRPGRCGLCGGRDAAGVGDRRGTRPSRPSSVSSATATPCWCWTTASTSSRPAPSWPTGCWPAAGTSPSWPPAGNRLAIPGEVSLAGAAAGRPATGLAGRCDRVERLRRRAAVRGSGTAGPSRLHPHRRQRVRRG